MSEGRTSLGGFRTELTVVRKELLAKISTLSSKLVGRIITLENMVDAKSTNKAKEAAAEIRRLYSGVFLKLTILTEVTGFARIMYRDKPDKVLRITLALNKASDNTDAWWNARRHLSLGEWVELAEELFIEQVKKEENQ